MTTPTPANPSLLSEAELAAIRERTYQGYDGPRIWAHIAAQAAELQALRDVCDSQEATISRHLDTIRALRERDGLLADNARLREALRQVKYKAVSLADAQVIALEALNSSPSPAPEVPRG